MSLNIPTHYVQSYSTSVSLLLQEKGSKLRSAVTEGAYVGSQASPVDQFGSVEMQAVTTRFAPMPRVDATTDRRWVFPSDFDLPQMIDSFDKLRLLTDPESVYVVNAVYAAGRQIDTVIIQAFMGTAKTGVAGATSTSFTAGNEVDVAVGGSNSRLNVQKLLTVKETMRINHVDFETDQVFCALTAKDESALLNEIQIISSDFNGGDRPVMKDGKITRFLGINFIYCELVESVAAGTNEVNVPVWAKSGMHLGIWNDVKTSISRRHDIQSEPWQAYVYLTCGATRLEENKVYNIESYRA
jgi:hypothetical protein